jgi:hypothetical protein
LEFQAEQAKAEIDKIERKITSDQIAEARKRVAAWKPKAN